MVALIREMMATLSRDGKIGRAAMVEQEALGRLDDRLTSFAESRIDSRAPMLIRPDECVVWDGNPRDQPGLNPDSCRSLIESIAAEGEQHARAGQDHSAQVAEHRHRRADQNQHAP